MEFPPFTSLGHVRILVVPVGNIKKQAFDKWRNIIRSFDTIRLGDIPPDGRDDYARFMPSPLSTGHIHLSFPSHPPPAWHDPLALFRPSDFPLGIIGIAECPVSSSLSSTLAQFNAELTNLFPPNYLYPLARNCYVFENEDSSSILNLGDSLPGMVVIPSVMGNKKLYIGTLIAELCSNILGAFADLARTVESPIGMETLNNNVFPAITSLSDQRNSYESPTLSRNSLPSNLSASGNSNQKETGISRSTTPVNKRTIALDTSRPGLTPRNASLAATVTPKSTRRQSGIGIPLTGRLFKLLGDLFLLAGRTSDACVWYGESLSLLSKFPQDIIWHASALEGLCTAQVFEAWTAGHGLHTSFSNEGKEPWLDLVEKLSQATTLYSRATPSAGAVSPDVDSSLITLVFTTCIRRHTSFLFSIWASKGWGPLVFTALIRPELPPTFTPSPPTESHRVRMSAITGISRAQIAGILAQAHGPFLLHLEPPDRILLLQYMATTYSCLGFRRKEVYVLRELLSTVMDVLVCSRDEVIKTARERSSGLAALGNGLGIGDSSAVGIRESESADGNQGIIQLVKYVCDVYGVDLESVRVVGPDTKGDIGVGETLMEGHRLQYGWDELQLGVVREAVAIAEALPEYSTVAQFDLSALRALHTIISSADQAYLYSNSAKALVTARRRGDDRRVEYWSGNPVVSLEITPLPLVRLPVEHRARDLLPPSEEASIVVGKRDPFIYNPRLLFSKSKSQAVVVQNEPIEFILTLQNPYAFDLEIQNLSLSTSGVALQSQPLAVTIPANSFHITRIVGSALEPGTLVVRGCVVQAHGGMPQEFVLPLATDEEDATREKSNSAWNAEVGRIKESGLAARPWIRNKRLSFAKGKNAKTTKASPEMSFLKCKVVSQQPHMRIRRTSLTHGAVMMYDGETSTIRLTVENVSNIPIEFIKVTCVDSTMAPAQQALAEGEMSVFKTYETEYDLLRRPVFRWDPDPEFKVVGPGKKAVLTIICSGKVGCTAGTIQISYSNIRQEFLKPSDVFYTRQVLYPVLVTVYNTLECYGMDILPFSSVAATRNVDNVSAEHDTWKRTLEGVKDEDGGWCLFTVDVRNTYGIPFEVTFELVEEAIPKSVTTRLVAPGSTSRIIVPVKRFLLPESQTSIPIPTLSDRQFVVSKSSLTSREEKHQRELFWYREELFERVKGRWREAGGCRFGWLSLRQQRFTAPMLDALRTDPARLRLTLVRYEEEDSKAYLLPSRGGRSITQPNRFAYLRTTLVNLSPESLILTLTLTLNPSEHVLYDGVLSNLPVGKLECGEEREIEFGICFVAEGKFELRAEAWVVDGGADEDAKAAEGELRVTVRSELC
ncbi:hypothetical protein K439DRAFT_1382134 [Ramaria rubella]|nr:hypothetical protein K439DRAFT_1382134 [Ramaria rubella]